MPKIPIKPLASFKEKLRESNIASFHNKPLWKGPIEDGITQSLVSDYLTCRERSRVRLIEGLRATEHFEPKIEYGNMWHLCEEIYAAENNIVNVFKPLAEYTKGLCRKYLSQQQEVDKWYNVCKVQFPIYVNYWKAHKDVKQREPVLQEYKFKILYTLPSGRQFNLLGKFDSVDIIGSRPNRGIFLQENKTKYEIDEQRLTRQLNFDLQTMFYLVALEAWLDDREELRKFPLMGVRYNVIRRPLSGGAGSIRRHKGTKNVPEETFAEYYTRLSGIIKESAPTYFARWSVSVTEQTIKDFKTQFLNPILENLIDDYEWWSYCYGKGDVQYNYLDRQHLFPHHINRHYRLPYGIYNPVSEGIETDVDNYISTGNKFGLERASTLFPEL